LWHVPVELSLPVSERLAPAAPVWLQAQHQTRTKFASTTCRHFHSEQVYFRIAKIREAPPQKKASLTVIS
jgi:hypothetical protein